MNKSSIQKKFRFIMVISALCFFITIVTPAYIRYGSKDSYPRVVMMWTVLFGTGGGSMLNNGFNFSWIAFIGYSLVLLLLIIELFKKFITVDVDDKKKSGNVSAADASGVICSVLALVMFILLPITITSASTEPSGAWAIEDYYGIGIAYILAYLILIVMVASSFIVLYAESIAKYMRIKEKKQQKEVKATKKAEATKVVEEPKEETVEVKEEDAKEETNE